MSSKMSAQGLLMFKTSLLLCISLLLVSCSFKEQALLAPNEKAFDEEDLYIMQALYAQEQKKSQEASEIYTLLYQKSAKKEYLYRSLESDLEANRPKKLLERIDKLLLEHADDFVLWRLKIITLVALERLDEAKSLSERLIKKTQKPDDYILMSEILVKHQEYDLALKYLESAYVKEYDEEILDKISIILYVNLGRPKDAIAYLETHTRVHGKSKIILMRLIGFYSDQNNIDGLLQSYKSFYNIAPDEQIAKKIIQIYTYKRDSLRLIDFLEDSGADDEQLLSLYASVRNYKKAYPLAEKLYTQSGDLRYLGQSAVYEYESVKERDSELLERVIGKLESVIKKEPSAMYLNYLGYLLIDHEVDVKQGMKYIREVLEMEPESAYYLDSLAWGHYKLGECKKAESIIQKVLKLKGGDNPEVLEHADAIKKCLKNKKR